MSSMASKKLFIAIYYSFMFQSILYLQLYNCKKFSFNNWSIISALWLYNTETNAHTCIHIIEALILWYLRNMFKESQTKINEIMINFLKIDIRNCKTVHMHFKLLIKRDKSSDWLNIKFKRSFDSSFLFCAFWIGYQTNRCWKSLTNNAVLTILKRKNLVKEQLKK